MYSLNDTEKERIRAEVLFRQSLIAEIDASRLNDRAASGWRGLVRSFTPALIVAALYALFISPGYLVQGGKGADSARNVASESPGFPVDQIIAGIEEAIKNAPEALKQRNLAPTFVAKSFDAEIAFVVKKGTDRKGEISLEVPASASVSRTDSASTEQTQKVTIRFVRIPIPTGPVRIGAEGKPPISTPNSQPKRGGKSRV